MTTTPYLVYGTVYTNQGTTSNSLVIINTDISTFTDNQGKYVLDLANLQDGYESGNSFTITGQNSLNNEFKSDTITVSGSNQIKNMILVDRDRNNEQGRPGGTLLPIILRTVGDKPISVSNLLP